MICTICARGGSKGIANKNLTPVLGKPLLWWTIQHARESKLFKKVAVSSDSQEILNAAEYAGADIVILRPDEMATDTAPKLAAIKHALEQVLAQTHIKTEWFVDLDATSPLRIPEDIVGAVKLLETSGCSNVITGSQARRSPYFNLVEENKDGNVSLSKAGLGIARRQDAPRAFDMNASIYVWNVERFLSNPTLFYEDTKLYEMPEERSQDIDSLLDLEIVTYLMERRERRKETLK